MAKPGGKLQDPLDGRFGVKTSPSLTKKMNNALLDPYQVLVFIKKINCLLIFFYLLIIIIIIISLIPNNCYR